MHRLTDEQYEDLYIAWRDDHADQTDGLSGIDAQRLFEQWLHAEEQDHAERTGEQY
jgi:hypothetical protein